MNAGIMDTQGDTNIQDSDVSSESSYVGSVSEHESDLGLDLISTTGFGLFLREKRLDYPQEELPRISMKLKDVWMSLPARERIIYDERAKLLDKHESKKAQ
ncbi:hypothetical protein K7432_003994 [Basidiobolus ranarum]|uniref:HMG box domain-containing protein n=1 Tax=Basidiobolus ranarum TaxID=34480 RepID=A0ABR2WYW8_9FUNG